MYYKMFAKSRSVFGSCASNCSYVATEGPVAHSMISANHWLRDIETYTFLCLVGHIGCANLTLSHSGQLSK